MNADRDAPLSESAARPGEGATLPPTANFESPTVLPHAANKPTDAAGVGLAPEPLSGSRNFGDYELLTEIARGGMGVVYKARQRRLNRTVAVKMILAGQLADHDDVRRFLSEAEAAAGLDHPGIVPVYESGEIAGQHFFSMGFVEGQSLAALLAAGPLPPKRAAELVAQVADAVEFAHQRGVIHRDLKPGNILLDSDGNPRVTDFGLAKRVTGDSGLTRTGQALGTPSFMPPEQASGKIDAIGRPADVYALGAVLYAALTGRPPFQAATPLDTILQVLEQEPVAPRQLNADVPRDLETIALKCLEKEPHKRYITARDLAAELRRFLRGEPIHARPVSRPERAWRWCRRNPVVAGLAAGVVVALLAGVGASSYFAIEASQRATAAEAARLDAQRAAEGERRQAILAKAERDRADKNAEEALNKAAVITEREAEIRKRLARQYQERGASLCAAGDSHHGMLWLMRAYHSAEPGDPVRLGVRRLLAGWCTEPDVTFYHPEPVASAQFVEGANRVVTLCTDSTCWVWDASTGRLVVGPIACTYGEFCISPSGKYLLTHGFGGGGKGTEITVRELSTGNVLWTRFLGAGSPPLNTFFENSVQLSRDDRLLVLFKSQGVTVLALDAQTGQEAGPPIKIMIPLIRLSADAKRAVLMGNEDRSYRLSAWNLETGERSGGLIDLPKPYVYCQVNSQADRAVTWNHMRGGHLWDVSEGRQIGNELPAGYTTTLLDNGRVLFIANQKKLSFIDPQTGQEIGAFEPPPKTLFSNGESLMVYVGEIGPSPKKLFSNGEPLYPGRLGRSLPRGFRAMAFAVSPDEKLVAVQTGDATLRIVETATTKPIGPDIATEGFLHRIVWNPESNLVATMATLRPLSPDTWFDPVVSQFQIRVWHAPSGTPLGEAIYPPAKAYCTLAFADEGRKLVLAATDGVVQVWSVPPGSAPLRELRSPSALAAASLVNRRQAVLLRRLDRTVHYRPIMLSDDAAHVPHIAAEYSMPQTSMVASTTGLQQVEFARLYSADRRTSVNALAVDPGGALLYCAHENWTGQEWHLESHAQVGQVFQHGDIVNAVAVSRDGRLLATGSVDRSVRVWDAATHEQVAGPFWHSEPVTSVAFVGDGTQVVSGAEDGAARIWDCRSNLSAGQPMRHAKAVRSVSVNPDGSRIVTGSDDETARVWNVATSEAVSEPLRHEGTVAAVAFSPDGKRFLTAAGAVHQWDASTMEAVSDPIEHGAKIGCATYSPDGETIVTAVDDQTLRVWDARSAQLALPALKLSHTVRNVAFHPTGESFFTAGGDGVIREWKLPAPLPDEPDRLRAWVEVTTTQDSTKPQLERLSWTTWTERQQQLSAAGGPFRASGLALSNEWATDPPNLRGQSLVSKAVICGQRLKKIAQAMADVALKEKKLPARASCDSAGRPLLSWRVHLLPLLGESKLYERFKLDEPWDSEHNQSLIAEIPVVYRSPWSEAATEGKTCFVVPVGPGTYFESLDRRSLGSHPSRTIVVVAVNWAHCVIWTKPEDLDLRSHDALEAMRGLVPGECLVAFAKGAVQLLPCDLPEEIYPRSIFMDHFASIYRAAAPAEKTPDAELIEQYRDVIHPLDEIRTAPLVAGAETIQLLERSLTEQVASQQWPEVRWLLTKLADSSPDNHYPWYQLALLNVYLNDAKALGETTAHIEKHFQAVRDPFIRERLTKTFALAQSMLPDLSIPEAWLESVRADPAPSGLEPWNPFAAALVDLARKQPDAALSHFERAEAANPGFLVLRASCPFARGLALSAKADRPAAVDAYTRGLAVLWTQMPRRATDRIDPKAFDWHEYLVARVLCRRAEEALFGREQTDDERERTVASIAAAKDDRGAGSGPPVPPTNVNAKPTDDK
jgi:eukaryotic-like serine/threonine-protein kinase